MLASRLSTLKGLYPTAQGKRSAALGKAASLIDRIWLKNYGPFTDAELALRPLTVLVGPNASGKSIALTSLYKLRRTDPDYHFDTMRKRGTEPDAVEINFEISSQKHGLKYAEPTGFEVNGELSKLVGTHRRSSMRASAT